MQKNFDQNVITLHGHVAAQPLFSHRFYEKDYYVFPLKISRLSGVVDTLMVGVTESQLEGCPLEEGFPLTVVGSVRSYNNRSGTGSRLVIRVHARTLTVEVGDDRNSLTLTGTPCKPPVYRRTPLGRDICDLLLAVNRPYGGADYLPCIAWGSLAVGCGEVAVGTPMALTGRMQSRVYTKLVDGVQQEHTAYEISIMSLEK